MRGIMYPFINGVMKVTKVTIVIAHGNNIGTLYMTSSRKDFIIIKDAIIISN